MNIIAWLEYKLAYYDSVVHRFNHYTTRAPHRLKLKPSSYLMIEKNLPTWIFLPNDQGIFLSWFQHDYIQGFPYPGSLESFLPRSTRRKWDLKIFYFLNHIKENIIVMSVVQKVLSHTKEEEPQLNNSFKTRKTNSDFCLNFCTSEAHTKVRGV